MRYSSFDKTKAWAVHLFTSSGIVAGLLAIIAIHEGDFRMAMIWLFVTFIIDGVDGTFARACKVTEVLPDMSGKTIDYVIDFATYAIIPAFFIYEAHILPDSVNLLGVALLLLTSSIYYGKEGMVSDDMYFIGFPVLWNVIAFYLFFVFQFDAWVNFGVVIAFCILHFIPLKYAYPSRKTRFQTLNLIACLVFFIANGVLLYLYPAYNFWATLGSVLALSYFGIMVVVNSFIKA